MTNIISFDSIFLINPLRKYYLGLIRKLLDKKEPNSKYKIILYRLDKDNIFIREQRNLSGISTGLHVKNIDALSYKFYLHLEGSKNCSAIRIKNQQLYSLYTRQVKLKLESVLKCALRIQNLSNKTSHKIEIVSDTQSISIIKEAFMFLNYSETEIQWTSHFMLTSCITINSFLMRIIAILKMIVTPATLPSDYFFKLTDPTLPSIVVTMPRRRPEDFFKSYVEKLEKKFNIFLYSTGSLRNTPEGYKLFRAKRTLGILRGMFTLKYLCWNSQSYIADILIIFKNHSNLSISIDIVNTIYRNKIDAHISRLQTNVLDNYFAKEARRKKIFVLGDIMEEIFYCDSAICQSESEYTDLVKLVIPDQAKVVFRGSNSLMKYRLSNFHNNYKGYLHAMLDIDSTQKIVFYASDPSKEESQRYITEKFLFSNFENNSRFTLVVKTHPQDDGKITNYAYKDSGKLSNIYLIGDATQKKKIASNEFNIFDKFDFNSAIASSDGFLTSSSTSILQALILGTRSGIVDLFDNGFYNFLLRYDAAALVKCNKSFTNFLYGKHYEINNIALNFCGLKNETNFDLSTHLHEILYKHNNDDFDAKIANQLTDE